jgi:hypothetical protein
MLDERRTDAAEHERGCGILSAYAATDLSSRHSQVTTAGLERGHLSLAGPGTERWTPCLLILNEAPRQGLNAAATAPDIMRLESGSDSVSAASVNDTSSLDESTGEKERHIVTGWGEDFALDVNFELVGQLSQGVYGRAVSARDRRTGEEYVVKKINNINSKVCPGLFAPK